MRSAGSVTEMAATADFTSGQLLVDGEPFPWALGKDAPVVFQYLPDLFEIRVTILDATPFTCSGLGDAPVIRGVKFPWELASGIKWSFPAEGPATIELGFYAREAVGFTKVRVFPLAEPV